MAKKKHFTPAAFRFLNDLKKNNNRDWFNANKQRYEDELREPALEFIRDFAPRLAGISPFFSADDRKVGGSLFRIYRDVRFSKDKSPYKTYTGVQFRHERGKDAHCPGFYLHLQPKEVFVGVGIWHPDGETLSMIRGAIDDDPKGWKKAIGGGFGKNFELGGESLKRAPKGYDPDHPLIEDLRRKDFIGSLQLKQTDVTSPGFDQQFEKLCRSGASLVKYLCDAVEAPY